MPIEPKTDKDDYGDDNQIRHSLQGYPEENLEILNDDYHKPVGHVYTDRELEVVVEELLKNSKIVNVNELTVEADNTNIMLNGIVSSESEKNAAGSIVQLIHGVGNIKNDLIVRTS